MSDTGAAAPPWFGAIIPEAAGFTAGDVGKTELIGYMQNRGYDKMEPAAAFTAAMKAHRNAEAQLGGPADQLLRMPKDAADTEGWARYNARMGVPADAKDYDFSTVKMGDKDLDPALAEALRPALLSARLPKDQAPAVAKAVADYLAKQGESSATAKAEALAAAREALKINWGSNVEANMLVAKGAAKALGVDEAAVAALENVIGYDKVMEVFRNIGTKIGEDQFITNQAPGGSGVMSGEQATVTLAGRQADSGWVNKLMEGDATTVKEFNSLTTMISAFNKR